MLIHLWKILDLGSKVLLLHHLDTLLDTLLTLSDRTRNSTPRRTMVWRAHLTSKTPKDAGRSGEIRGDPGARTGATPWHRCSPTLRWSGLIHNGARRFSFSQTCVITSYNIDIIGFLCGRNTSPLRTPRWALSRVKLQQQEHLVFMPSCNTWGQVPVLGLKRPSWCLAFAWEARPIIENLPPVEELPRWVANHVQSFEVFHLLPNKRTWRANSRVAACKDSYVAFLLDIETFM